MVFPGILRPPCLAYPQNALTFFSSSTRDFPNPCFMTDPLPVSTQGKNLNSLHSQKDLLSIPGFASLDYNKGKHKKIRKFFFFFIDLFDYKLESGTHLTHSLTTTGFGFGPKTWKPFLGTTVFRVFTDSFQC